MQFSKPRIHNVDILTFQASSCGVDTNRYGDEEGCCVGGHASQGCHDGSSSQDQHGAHNDVGQEAEEEEHLQNQTLTI